MRMAKSIFCLMWQNDPNETNNLAGRPEVADVETALRLQILERVMQTQLKEPFRQ